MPTTNHKISVHLVSTLSNSQNLYHIYRSLDKLRDNGIPNQSVSECELYVLHMKCINSEEPEAISLENRLLSLAYSYMMNDGVLDDLKIVESSSKQKNGDYLHLILSITGVIGGYHSWHNSFWSDSDILPDTFFSEYLSISEVSHFIRQ